MSIKAKKLNQLHKRYKQRQAKMRRQMERELEAHSHKYTEKLLAAMVRIVCTEQQHLMDSWGHPIGPLTDVPHIKLRMPNGDLVYVYGGPYRRKPDGVAGLKMAEEIDLPCDIDIPTRDFSVPDADVFEAGIIKAVDTLLSKGELYVGCMGGIGRTGLAIAAILKFWDMHITQVGPTTAENYRDKVRMYINPHAVETKQQLDYIDAFIV